MSHIKITGFLFTALAGFLLGFSARRKIYRHAETLARMSDILSRLYSEISYAHSSPEDFFEVLSAENDYIGRFFKTVLDKMRKRKYPLAAAWGEAINEHSEELCLTDSEKAELVRLGKAIGRLDLEGALKAVGLTYESFKSRASAARDTKRNEGRLKLALYSAGGILLALLLI